MARNRIAHFNQAVYTGNIDGSEISQLFAIQDSSHTWNVPRTDVSIFGKRAPRARIPMETPTVTFNTSWLTRDGTNEANIGLDVSGAVSAISNILNGGNDQEKNYYVWIAPEGEDAIGATTGGNHYAFGNMFLTSYNVTGSLNEPVISAITVEGLNARYGSGLGGDVPSIDPEDGDDLDETFSLTAPQEQSNVPIVLRRGFITVTFGAADIPGTIDGGSTEMHIQDFNIEATLSRTPLERLKSRFAFTRTLDQILPVTFSVTALMSDIKNGNVADFIRTCESGGDDLAVDIKECDDDAPGDTAIKYDMKNMYIDEQGLDIDTDSNETVNLTFTGYMGGETDTTNGLFITGSAGS